MHCLWRVVDQEGGLSRKLRRQDMRQGSPACLYLEGPEAARLGFKPSPLMSCVPPLSRSALD
jgi:hypothetical protein